MKRKVFEIFKWSSLALTVFFTLISCGESLLSSDKTSDQVGNIIDGSISNTAKYVPLKSFDVEIENPKENNIYYCGQTVDFKYSFNPTTATYKTLNYKINDPELLNLSFNTNQMTFKKPGHAILDFYVEKEEKLGTKTIEFDIKKLQVNKFNILDKDGNVVNNKDIIFDTPKSEPQILTIDTDSIIARDALLKIEVEDDTIANVVKEADKLKIIPLTEGRTTITLTIDDLKIKLYVSTIEATTEKIICSTNPLVMDKDVKQLINTIYFHCDDTRMIDPERLRVEFQEDTVLEIALKGIIYSDNRFYINFKFKEDEYYRIGQLSEGTIVHEKLKIYYDYPGGKSILLHQDKNGTIHDYIDVEIHAIPSFKASDYIDLPDEVSFGYLVNDKNEVYVQDYIQYLNIKLLKETDSRYLKNCYKFEVLGENSEDLYLNKSAYDKLCITLKDGIVPKESYTIRFTFNKFRPEFYKDIKVNFKVVKSIPKDEKYIFDFKHLYGYFDKTGSGQIPTNYSYMNLCTNYSEAGDRNQFDIYEVRDLKGNEALPFKSAGLKYEVLDCNSENMYVMYIGPNYYYEPTVYPDSHYNENFHPSIKIQARDKMDTTLKIRFTSPAFEFFGVEEQWTEYEIIIHDSPEQIEAKIDEKVVQTLTSNVESPIYECENSFNVGDKTRVKLSGIDEEYYLEDRLYKTNGYAPFHKQIIDGVEYFGCKDVYHLVRAVGGGLANIVCTKFETTDSDVAHFSDSLVTFDYPGDAVLTFKIGTSYPDRDEYEFKMKVHVNGEKSPVDVHKIGLETIAESEHKYSKNDLSNNIVRMGSSFKLDFNNYSEELINKYVSIECSDPSIIYFDENTNSFKAIRNGECVIYLRNKEANKVIEKKNIIVTNTTSPFNILKGDFIDLNTSGEEPMLIAHVKKQYRIKITPFVDCTSKTKVIKELNDTQHIISYEGGLIETVKGGETVLEITYGDATKGETEFKKNIKLKIIDNSQQYNKIAYGTRKFLGHFGLNGAISFFATIFCIMLFYDKKKWNYAILPCALGYSALIAFLSEVVQYFIPTRCFAATDVLINFLGALTAFLLVFITYIIYALVKLKSKKRVKINLNDSNESNDDK